MQRWKSECRNRVRSAEDGEQRGEGEGRRCKGANQPSGCAKVERLIAKQITEYRVRREGRGVASPRPCFHRSARRSHAPTRGRAIPYPPNANRYPPTLARSANLIRYKVKRGTGERDVGRRTDATQSRPYPMYGGQREACLLSLSSVLRTLSSFPLPTCFQRGDWSK